MSDSVLPPASTRPVAPSPTRVRFESSHAGGGCSDRRLTVRIARDDPLAGVTIHDEIFFEVPSDFQAHHDAVGAALMTLFGRAYAAVEFNFPISAHCAETLAAYYALDDIGPVDASLAPRERGRFLGLNFSGGLDSTAVWVILRDLMREELKVIHANYGPLYAGEQLGTVGYHKDVDCATDLRAQRYDQAGRFLAAVPLLFADYAGLGSVAHGNPYFHYPPLHVESTRDGSPPAFLAHDAVFGAGGLDELHLIRGLMTWSTLKILVTAAPERVEAALSASARPGTVKHAIKSLALRDTYERLDEPLPPFLRAWTPPRTPSRFGERLDVDTWALYFLRTRGPEFVGSFVRGADRLDLAPLDDISYDFLTRYNPSLIQVIPEPLRGRFMRVLHEFDIYPYTERDWRDLDRYRAFLLAHMLDG